MSGWLLQVTAYSTFLVHCTRGASRGGRLSVLCRFVRQVLALSRKNVLMLWRNRASTFIRLGSCIFFMLLMFCIIEAINVTIGNQSHVRNLPSPSP